jgi:hypothetical protein
MSVDLGDRVEDSLIYFMWSTNAADGSSITRATNGTISIYKNDDLTQSVAGITDTEDFDSLTGIHMCKIDTSADAFYANAKDYTVVLSGAIIDGKSVNAVLAVFSIENWFMRGTNSAALATTALTNVTWTDARAGYIDNLSAGAVALASGVDLTSIHGVALTETVNGYLAAAFVKLFDVVTPLLVASDVMRGTDSAYTGTPPTVTQIRQEMDSNSTKMAPSQVLADYKATGFNTVVPDVAGTAATPTEVATALTDIHLDHLLAVNYDPASKPGVATALLNELVENDGGVSRYTANALEQAPSGGTNPNVLVDTTIATVTDQTHIILTAGSNDNDAYKDQAIVVYDASDSDYPSVRVVSAYTGATKTVTLDTAPDFTMVDGDGSKIFVTAPGTTAPTVGQIRTEMEGAGYKLALIEADTSELQGDWVTGGRLDLILDIIAADTTTDIPSLINALNNLSTAQVNTECDTALTDYDPPTRAEATTDKDAIITEVNANETKIDTIDGIVDSILVDTGTTIPGTITTLQADSTAIKAKTDALPSGIAKNVALPGFNLFMVLASDDKTGATGKTVTCTISKDGGAFGASANSVVEISSGMYKIDLTQAEMNYDVVTLRFTATDCNDRILTIYTS